MKKQSLKSKILLGAFLFAGLGAGAKEVASYVANAFQQQYTWQQVDKDGNPIGDPFQATVNQARSQTGCTGAAQVCAEGTAPGLPTETIHYVN